MAGGLKLLAKPNESLIEHTENVLKVLYNIKRGFPEVPYLCNKKNFWRDLFFASFLHDFGKGAAGFQKYLKTNKKWNYRHEILSAGFVSAIDNLTDTSKEAIALAIITHHKDIIELREKYATFPEDDPGFTRYQEKLHELPLDELNNLLDLIPVFSKKYLGEVLKNYHKVKSTDELSNAYRDFVIPYYKAYRTNQPDEVRGMYGLFMKGFLTAADHLASSGRTDIKYAVKSIKELLQFKQYRDIQNKASKTKGSAFLIAPTGSGKTEAALLWAHNNENPERSKRVFYVLPYTASINFMYKRFAKIFGGNDIVGILHGKSEYFLYKFFSELSDNIQYNYIKEKVREVHNLSKKIYKPYKIVTPFQLIKPFFSVKGFEQNISEMAGGIFIFDEIHTYDPRTTALIVEISRFIKEKLNGKFFFMTATMPSFLKKVLKESLFIRNELTVNENNINNFDRHRISIIEGDVVENLDRIKVDLRSNKRVLVVLNTVRMAQRIYSELKGEATNAALLHSKFILRDREKIESGLKEKDLLVGTQAIEVSLDIDYDVLYSEPAPIDALLQRFGRVNRKGEKGIANVYVFSRGSGISNIYPEDRVVRTLEALQGINNEVLHEREIQGIVDLVYGKGYNEKEKEIFTNVTENFNIYLNSSAPFVDVKKKENEFYRLFDSVEVIPSCFANKYIEEIEQKRFYESVKYITSISNRELGRLYAEGRVNEIEKGIVVSAKYDPELGLLINENASDTFESRSII